MSDVDNLWTPEQLKLINDNPKVLSLLYDLNLLPEVVLTHLRRVREEERATAKLKIRELHDALEWCARSLNAIGQSKGLVVDHGDALDNALKLLCGCLVGTHFQDCRYGFSEKGAPPAPKKCDSYLDGNQCEETLGHQGEHRCMNWTWVVTQLPNSTGRGDYCEDHATLNPCRHCLANKGL